jgi:sigma-70-like protein
VSAALQLPLPQLPKVWAAIDASQRKPLASAVQRIQQHATNQREEPAAEPVTSYAFYRKHTENMLRRYLYASMQVGRSPSLLGESVGRGWVSSRKVRTFEDAVIFVLDVERCLEKLPLLDRQLISRIVLQEYTQNEVASLLGVSVRTVGAKFPMAIDRLTEMLVKAQLLVLPA